MTEELFNQLITQSIALELNMAALYRIFSEALSDDTEFWWELHLEERSHASLIRAAKDSFSHRDKFPYDLIANSIEEIRQANALVLEKIEYFKLHTPTRKEACSAAIELEKAAGEKHFMSFMNKEAENSVESVFQQLNRGDKEHEKRISQYQVFLPAKA